MQPFLLLHPRYMGTMGWQLELVLGDIPQFFPRLPFPKKYAPRRVLCLWQASPKMRKMLGDLTSCSLQSSQYCVQIGKKIMWILASFPLPLALDLGTQDPRYDRLGNSSLQLGVDPNDRANTSAATWTWFAMRG